MPAQDQLEIINPNGEIRFYALDPSKGITNIGRHPENDVVIDSEQVAYFHAVLDHRQKPYRLVVLSQEGKTLVGGQALSANAARELRGWEEIELDGHRLILLEGQGAAAPPPVTSPTSVDVSPMPIAPSAPPPSVSIAPPPMPAPTIVPAPVAPAAPPTLQRLNLPQPDQADELILTELAGREWTIDVEQSAVCQLTIVNGGDIVATFHVSVDGVDESWVTLSPPQVNLVEGERAVVNITITPPRHPTSLAGPHHLAVVVTSPNYPGHSSRRGATLTINPYYDFAVGELSPKQQKVSWRKRIGEVSIPIANRGNSLSTVRLDGEDDERGCRFEFRVPGQETTLLRQAEVRVRPDETVAVPVRITPIVHRMIGLRGHTYSYTITALPLEGGQTPRSVLGQIKSTPLIGPWLIALMTLLLAVCIVLIFRPTIGAFTVDADMIRAGEEVTLSWRASQFASLEISPEVGAVRGPEGSKKVAPKEDVTYKLTATNLLSRLNAAWFSESRQVSVVVEPVKPIIRVFSANKQDLLSGEQVTIAWEVLHAETLTLITNGANETLLSSDHTGKRTLTPNDTTTFELVAENRYGVAKRNLKVLVSVPTATPLPLPVIQRFDVGPAEITAGQAVKIDWAVLGAKTVSIAPVFDGLPLNGSIEHAPDKTTAYILTASNGQAEVKSGVRQVTVKPAPTPTPQPVAPQIAIFVADPSGDIVRGRQVTLHWEITGDVTNVELFAGTEIGKLSFGASKQGDYPVTPSRTTVFILTAYNGSLSSNKTLEVKVLEPPTATPSPTTTPVPPIVSFRCESGANPPDPTAVRWLGNTCQVRAGADVMLKWETQNAAKVELTVGGETSSNLGPSGSYGPFRVTTPPTQPWRLKASGPGGDTYAELRVELLPLPTPPPPFNLQGQVGVGSPVPITLTWQYDFQYQDIISGFRVYRSDNNAAPVPVADINQLGKQARSWTDHITPACGVYYYVVAVYVDLYNQPRETGSTRDIFKLPACPGAFRYPGGANPQMTRVFVGPSPPYGRRDDVGGARLRPNPL